MGEPHPHSHSQPHSIHDFYTILTIPKGSSLQDIRKAYKSLVMKWHPDRHPHSHKQEAETKFKAIAQAYEALTSYKEKRSMHSVYRSRGDKEGKDFLGMDSDPSTSGRGFKHKSVDASIGASFLPRSTSCRATNAPIHSYSTIRRKPPPIERKLECTLEELRDGCVKKIKVIRDVIAPGGKLAPEEEILKIRVKPGWKKGTKITFEGMGDERPGTVPADLVFEISEKHHPMFKRDGNDLVLATEIPLVKALTGFTLSIPLLGGEKMSIMFHDIINPGYEKVIKGQGMPDPKEPRRRGDLRVKFHINFPARLSDEQRFDIRSLFPQEDS